MEPRDLLLVAVRWLHAAAAVLLVGGSAFCLLVLAPAVRQGEPDAAALWRSLDVRFKELLELSLVVFLVSGGLLTFERLSSGAATSAYAVILGLKVLLSVLVFHWAFQVRRGRGWESREARLMVGAGFVVIFLAALLKTIYEGGLRP